MTKKTVLLLMIVVSLWTCYDAISAFVDPSIANFMYIAELNSTSIDEYMSKNVDFIQNIKRKVVDHINYGYVADNLYETYYNEFREREDGSFEYNNYRNNYTIVSGNDVSERIKEDPEFQMLFHLYSYLENFYSTTESILRAYYISDDDYMVVYPKQNNNSIYFKDFYAKFLNVDSSVMATSNGIVYMYDVFYDHITNEQIIALQSPVIINDRYRGNVVIEVKTSVFDEITLKNFLSFATTTNLGSVIYYDDTDEFAGTGVDIIDNEHIERNFLDKPIRIDKYIRRLNNEQYIYFQKNKIIFAKDMESSPIEYYQIADINFLLKEVKIQLYFLAYMVIILLYYISYNVASRIKLLIDNKTIEKLTKEKNKLELYANIDHVTGLYNKKYIESYFVNLDKHIKVCYSIAICDINFYNNILQTHGEKAAKRTLLRLIDIIKSAVPNNTIIARWNEGEIMLLLPEKNEEAAVVTVDDIRKAVSVLVIDYNENGNGESTDMQISFGLTVNRDFNKSPYAVVEEADKALNISKKRGGNIVTVYSNNVLK